MRSRESETYLQSVQMFPFSDFPVSGLWWLASSRNTVRTSAVLSVFERYINYEQSNTSISLSL